jgi:hypothetical protein
MIIVMPSQSRIVRLEVGARKADVEGELPGRTVTNYFVAMADEQRQRYDEYSAKAARLIQVARKRPLRPEEFERLQRYLACMRMICDTPAILDPTCRVSPKLEELERVLGDAVEPGQARAAHRPSVAQAPTAHGDGRQPRLRGLDRARHGASARCQAGAC